MSDIKLFDPSQPLKTFKGTKDAGHVTFSVDGGSIFSGWGDHNCRLWEIDGKPKARLFKGHSWSISCIALSPDGKLALSGAGDAIVILWDLNSGKELKRFSGGDYHFPFGLAFSADSRFALAATTAPGKGHVDSIIILWDLENGEEISRFKTENLGKYCAFSPDGSLAFTISGNSEPCVIFWELKTGKEMFKFVGTSSQISSFGGGAVTKDGSLAISGHGKTVYLWDLKNSKELKRFEGHRENVCSLAFSPDGSRALSGGYDGTVRLWDLENGVELCCFEHPMAPSRSLIGVLSVAISPDGNRALTARTNTICLWALPD